MNSAIYQGVIRHRRFQPKAHHFSYPLYMLALDLDELKSLSELSVWFSSQKWAPLRFQRQDYLDGQAGPLKPAVLAKLDDLGADPATIDTIVLLCQVRCFGLYFSPINAYFCYADGHAKYMLVEVNNTPWGERHFYLVDAAAPKMNPKDFHVSPFMEMDMNYHWQLTPPALEQAHKPVRIHIELERTQKIFDATLSLTGHTFGSKPLTQVLRRWPFMSGRIVAGIYWQALRLFLKAIPFVPHPRRQ